ncbi:hypothetical protein LSH36_1130g00002 [Paralvinella palmiformis]|uniref:NSFL1 cofactor p47 n=1 Tax=Paralvinella palmiformis TaxID=53620 RepID=A0AAD9IVE8_9ANNE|nr:hypothetical protein LSH36_1130g00002 [Paralvinella palmiformis]
MSDSEKSALISEFSAVTGVDGERARFYLESSQWMLDLALGSFYDNGDDVDPEPATVPSGRESTRSSRGLQSKPQPRGQQILDPRKKKKKDADKLVQDMFKAARQHGAEEVGAGTSSESHSNIPVFRGTAYRLGDSEDSSTVVPGFSTNSQPKQVEKVLKLWKDGFSIDDGPLRGYGEPENEQFLNSIKKGEIPKELLDNARGGEVNLSMEDHRNEDYIKPKTATKAFSGTGIRLGRLVTKFNHFHTIADVRNYINLCRPQYITASYILMTTFPNKELTDDTQTLEDAKLLNAVLVQRIK